MDRERRDFLQDSARLGAFALTSAALWRIDPALAQSGQLTNAIPYFRAAIKLRPDFADAQNNLGTALFMQGNYAEAAKAFYAALQNSPYNAEFAANLGDTLVRLGNKSAAAECYQHALQLEPDNQAVQKKLQSLRPVTSK